MPLSQKHLLGIKDITTDDINLIFQTADNFKDRIKFRLTESIFKVMD